MKQNCLSERHLRGLDAAVVKAILTPVGAASGAGHIDYATCISCKIGHQMAPLALVIDSIPWVRCASGNVFSSIHLFGKSPLRVVSTVLLIATKNFDKFPRNLISHLAKIPDNL